MAAKVKKEECDEEKKVVTPQEAMATFLKETKEDHYNFEPDNDYTVKCSSLQLTSALAGGLTPGAHRFVGLASGGKTSCALDFMYHFLNTPSPMGKERRGIYLRSEGRLSKQIQERSGVVFTKKPEEWGPGTCFVHETNIYENAFAEKRKLINLPNCEFFWITDSTDSLIKKDDAEKSESESITVGGGSLITSVFLKKVGLAMMKRGHIDVYISQVRDQIKINQYEVTIPKQGKASGPRALEHQANVVLEFLPRFGGDLIQEEKKGPILGHWCKTRIVKSDNEKNMLEIKYPIRYNQTGAKSVWAAYELVDFMVTWEILKKAKSWFSLDEKWKEELTNNDCEVFDTLQGTEAVRDWLDQNPKAFNYLFDRCKSLLV